MTRIYRIDYDEKTNTKMDTAWDSEKVAVSDFAAALKVATARIKTERHLKIRDIRLLEQA